MSLASCMVARVMIAGETRVLSKKPVFICPECKLPVDRSKPYHDSTLLYHESCWKTRIWRHNYSGVKALENV
jgi:hypothetical protein